MISSKEIRWDGRTDYGEFLFFVIHAVAVVLFCLYFHSFSSIIWWD